MFAIKNVAVCAYSHERYSCKVFECDDFSPGHEHAAAAVWAKTSGMQAKPSENTRLLVPHHITF